MQNVDNEILGWRLKPNWNGYLKGARFTVNRYGFRGEEPSFKKLQDVSRIIVLGDSLTLGEGVKDDETFSAQLQQSLNREGVPKKYEVLNFGVSGYTYFQELELLKTEGLKFKPDMVIFCTFRWDFQPTNGRDKYRKMIKNLTLFKRVRNHLFIWHGLNATIHQIANRLWLSKNLAAVPGMDDYNEIRDILATTQSFLKRNGLKCLLVNTGPKLKIIENVCLDLKIDFFQLDFLTRSKDLRIYPMELHPNKKGHSIIAQEIGKYLIGKYAKKHERD